MKKATIKEPFYIARGVLLNNSSSNTIDTKIYDLAGNTEDATQQTSVSLNTSVSSSYTYNDNGCMSGDGTLTYGYDYENRLINVSESGSIIWTSQYDAVGRRIKKQAEGDTFRYIYDGQNVIEIRDGSNSLLGEYVHGIGIDNVLRLEQTDDSVQWTYYFHHDGMGSVSELTDKNKNLVQAYEYDAWGNPTIYDPDATTGAASNPDKILSDFMYTGREWESNLGIYYYRARHYALQVGRFLQPDPEEYIDGANVYIYVKNMPSHSTDPFGLRVPIYDAINRSNDVRDGRLSPMDNTPAPGGNGIKWKPTVYIMDIEFDKIERGQVYLAETDKGRNVRIFKPYGKNFWCHGYTFDGHVAEGGPYSLFGDYVSMVLEDGGWKHVCCACAHPGEDIVVFYGQGKVTHSGKITSIARYTMTFDEGQSMISSKWGIRGRELNNSSFTVNVKEFNSKYKCFSQKDRGKSIAIGSNEIGAFN